MGWPGPLIASAALALALLISIPAARAETPVPSDVLALIDGEAVSMADYEAFSAGYLRQKLYHGGSPSRVKELRLEAAWELIRERLVLREANRRSIPGDPEGVDAQLMAIKAKYADASDWPRIEAELPSLRQALLDRTKVEALRAEISRVETPSQAELRQFYERNLDRFTQPEGYRLRVILVGVDPSSPSEAWAAAKARAERLHAELQGGAAFEALAAAQSTHESAASGGDLGLIHRGQLSDAAQAPIDGLGPGQVTEPVRLLEGYGLFRLDERIAPKVVAFESVEERARDLYGRERAAAQWDRFIVTLQGQAEIVLNQASLDAGRDGVDGLE